MSGLTCMAITGNGAAGLSAAAVAGDRQRRSATAIGNGGGRRSATAIGNGGGRRSATAIPVTVSDVNVISHASRTCI